VDKSLEEKQVNLSLVIAAAAVAFVAREVKASTLLLDSVDGVTDSAGDLVGPYNGRLDGLAYNIFCDDFDHHIGIPDSETVNVSTVTDLHLTRFGGVAAATSLYEQVFYLATYLTNASASQRADVQDAMWSYFSTNAPNQAKLQVQGWLNQAKANYAGKDYSSFRVMTEVNTAANPTAQFDGKQELFLSTVTRLPGLTSTPEPATWAMLLTGLGGFAFARFRRRAV